MKILRLLNKIFLSILLIFSIFVKISHSEEQPVDIWNIDKSKMNQNNGTKTEDINQKIKKKKFKSDFN